LAGFVLAAAALPVLLWVVLPAGDPWRTGAVTFYALSLALLYGASALYHGVRGPARLLGRLQRLDHVAIFFLIAGTYAPVCLIALRGPVGWGLMAGQAAVGAAGIALAVWGRTRAHEAVRVALYLVMGWMVALAAGPVRAALPPAGQAWLVAGGVAYTLGAVVFATDRPHLWPGRFSAHDLWHLFVLTGSALHFVFVLRFVAPAG
jgi:hemolysin III